MKRCPKCGKTSGKTESIGDLLTCPGCGDPFWALDWREEGVPAAPPEKALPSAVTVLGLHLGVLLAEAILALAVVGILVGTPLWAVTRLLGAR